MKSPINKNRLSPLVCKRASKARQSKDGLELAVAGLYYDTSLFGLYYHHTSERSSELLVVEGVVEERCSRAPASSQEAVHYKCGTGKRGRGQEFYTVL